jgi:hypothetical protein
MYDPKYEGSKEICSLKQLCLPYNSLTGTYHRLAVQVQDFDEQQQEEENSSLNVDVVANIR